MKNKDQITIELHGKLLYKVKYKINWSIVIIPDNILIDDYHGKGGHIHTDPKKHEIQEPIKSNDETVKNLGVFESYKFFRKSSNFEKMS